MWIIKSWNFPKVFSLIKIKAQLLWTSFFLACVSTKNKNLYPFIDPIFFLKRNKKKVCYFLVGNCRPWLCWKGEFVRTSVPTRCPFPPNWSVGKNYWSISFVFIFTDCGSAELKHYDISQYFTTKKVISPGLRAEKNVKKILTNFPSQGKY